MTEAWVQSLFDEEPEVYGPKARDITKGIRNKALAHSPTKGNSWGPDETKVMFENPNGAPPLDWWNVSEEEVRRRLILAMCPERVCRTCGEPSRRIVEQSVEYREARAVVNAGQTTSRSGREEPSRGGGGIGFGGGASSLISNGKISAVGETVGWTDCGHDDWRPGVVLDPFA